MNLLNCVFKVVYKMIYIYSCFEIFVETKYGEFEKTDFMKKIKNYFVSENIQPIQQFLFIEDGNQIMLYKSLEKKDNLLFEPENYDFIIRNDYREKKNKWMNYKILYKNFQEITDYEISTASFLSFVVYYEDKIIDILLETEKYNYMVVGNRINSKFIYYLLKNMNINVGSYINFDYHIQVVTHDVNILTLNSKQELVIGKKNVTIV